MPSLKRVLKEPLLHFAVIGAVLFLAYSLTPGYRATSSEVIVVSRGKIEQLATSFAKTWQRPPTETELKGLIDDWVREEIAVREAISMGLDRDDTVVRRRLRQKLEFLSDDAAAQVAPSEEDLKAYLAAHPQKFQVEQRYTFRHVYLNPERHSTGLEAKLDSVRDALRRMGATGDFVSLGDPFLLDSQFEKLPSSEVAKQFGSTFASALARLVPGKWEGPVQSGYGLHFVQVQERADGRLPDLAEVGDAVRREWGNDRRLSAIETFYTAMLKRYAVRTEPVEPVLANEAGR